MREVRTNIFSITFFILLFEILSSPSAFSQVESPSDTTKSPSGVDTTVIYSAKDSVIYSLSTRFMNLYGSGDIKYRSIGLKAENIDINWDTALLHARGVADKADTTKKKYRDLPILIDGGEQYKGFTISYNFKTTKGKINRGDTEIEQGYYHGEDIKKVDKDVLFVENGRYTTCDKNDPHYFFFSPKMKVIVNDKVIAEPVYLYIGGVPVFGLPFGIFPSHGGRRSGIVTPAYGEDFRRGRFLTHFGYFLAMSDYTDVNLLFDYYMKGGWVAHSLFRYALRYEFSGSLSANFTNTHFGEKFDPDRSEQREYNFHITHNQQLNPSTRMDVDFTFTSGNYYQNTSTNLSDLLRQTVVSNATLSKTWEGTNNSMSINLYRNQNLQTGESGARLPQISFVRTQSFPFRHEQRGRGLESYGSGELAWYELIGYSYNAQFLNTITRRNVTTLDVSGLPVTQRRQDERRGLNHNISVNASPKLGEFNVTPFFNYTERWYDKSIRKANFITALGTDSVVTTDVSGFRAMRFFNLGISASTRLYGIFPVNALGIAGFRHTITPSISYSFQPDFSKPRYNYYGTYIDHSGNTLKYSFFEREVFGGAPQGEVQSINLNVGHLFEMKTLATDSAQEEKKYQLLNLGTSVSYNFVADSLKLSELGVSYRTNVANALDISGFSSFNFYKFDPVSRRRINKFLISGGGGLAQLTLFTINLSTSLRGEKKPNKVQAERPGEPQPTPEITGQPSGYYGIYEREKPDFGIPWNLTLRYDFSLSRADPTQPFRSSNLYVDLGFNLTENWKISTSASYNFITKQIAAPVVNVYRDLHCWELLFYWIPRGVYREFRLELRIKAPQLQDVKITKQGSTRGVY